MNEEINKSTPMMIQYNRIKEEYKDSILLFRLGDFYEIFNDDAIVASEILNIKLTKRNPKSEILMCGMPYHASEKHITELLKNNKSVAICEQVSDFNLSEKGIMGRRVTRYLTPSDLIEFSDLGYDYFKAMSIYFTNDIYNVSILNINTGDLTICEKDTIDDLLSIINDVSPIEIISNIDLKKLTKIKTTQLPEYIFRKLNIIMEYKLADEVLVEKHKNCIRSSNALLTYIGLNNSKTFNNIKKIRTVDDDYLVIDNSSFSNLNLIESKYSLFALLNKTKTLSGARRLKDSIKRPFNNKIDIEKRNVIINYLMKNNDFKKEISEGLVGLYDVERIISQISSGNIKPSDLRNLSKTIRTMIKISDKIDIENKDSFSKFKFNKDIVSFMAEIIDSSISDEDDEANENIFIKRGYDHKVDSYIDDLNKFDDFVIDYINKIKEPLISQNEKLSSINITNSTTDGLCIEVPKRLESQFNDAINNKSLNSISNFKNDKPYIIKSIKAKSRYKNSTLLGIEEEKIILNDRLKVRQDEIYKKLVKELSKKSIEILSLSNKISEIDVINSFTDTTIEHGFIKPVIGRNLLIMDSYHPLLLLNDVDIVKNDICFGESNTHLITGPNMSGKSTFMRQAATIIIMYQMGCYIPASSGEVKIYDKILSRVGSNDDMSCGKSTFMVEMMDVANIFKNATENSFVIVDEVGRGTKPEDGEKLAIAITEGLMDIGCDTLISTHYDGLARLDNDRINKMYLSTEILDNGDIFFSHKLSYGYSSNSYAFEMAKLAGVPDFIMNKIK